MKDVKSIYPDTSYEVSNENILVCGDCDFCLNPCEMGRKILASRIGAGA